MANCNDRRAADFVLRGDLLGGFWKGAAILAFLVLALRLAGLAR